MTFRKDRLLDRTFADESMHSDFGQVSPFYNLELVHFARVQNASGHSTVSRGRKLEIDHVIPGLQTEGV